ncbi:MAG: class I SAM-dependent methyltransferase [Chitinophagaceae bacterium]|nr:class I SAM-dependent methyltransferase [Chitinophagaceae bacterium]
MSSERQLLESESRWWGEHVHRYREALVYIGHTDTVLDIACGTGFGAAIIAEHTSGMVTGGDIATAAIEECKTKWNRANLNFRVLDGTALDFSDSHFDVIVSFETIEHTKQYVQMLAEFARVLKPGGRLVLSTPNAAITSPDGVIPNPYHTQEFRYEELQQVLSAHFNSASVYGQRYSRYDKLTLQKKLGRICEKLMLSFGIRKLSYRIRNGCMKLFFGHSLYPVPADFVIETDPARIRKESPVLFAVCNK